MKSKTPSIKMNSDQIIEQFIHSCSHDLRAPLTSIKGLVKVAEYYPQNEEVHNCFQMIDRCTDTMDKLIRGLEEFMVINHYAITPETINYQTLVDNIIEDYQAELKNKSIAVQVNINTPDAVITDRLISSLIFKHLFKNAIAFQDEKKNNKFVSIDISSDQNFIQIKVSDNGIGISSAYNQKIFRPFFKASTQSKGVGMGLFLLNNSLTKINGKITFESKEQIGTSFTVLLPRLVPVVAE